MNADSLQPGISGPSHPALRLAQPEDSTWVAQLYHDVWHETHAPLMPREAAALRPYRFFVERTQSILSQCIVDLDRSGFVAWQADRIGQLWLVPAARGTGLARLLQDAALSALKDAGHMSASLDCLAANARGLGFYGRTGWTRAALLDLPVVPGSTLTVPFWRLERCVS
jgi:GNAT superfamily N-acetyltransferase